MQFTPEQVHSLTAPLLLSVVKERKGAKGRSLSYIEGWHAIAEANRIFGFGAWSRELRTIERLGDYQEDGRWCTSYMATVRVTVGDVVRDGTGYGSGIDHDRGAAHESAIKEAETDAMKRALMTFGNPFGLALYDKTQANVEKDSETAGDAPTADEPAQIVKAKKVTTAKPVEDGPSEKWDEYIRQFQQRVNACTDQAAIDALIKVESVALGQLKADLPVRCKALSSWTRSVQETKTKAAA